MTRCRVCNEPHDDRQLLCGPCGRSLDRHYDRDATLFGAIAWAANRARHMHQRRRDRR